MVGVGTVFDVIGMVLVRCWCGVDWIGLDWIVFVFVIVIDTDETACVWL